MKVDPEGQHSSPKEAEPLSEGHLYVATHVRGGGHVPNGEQFMKKRGHLVVSLNRHLNTIVRIMGTTQRVALIWGNHHFIPGLLSSGLSRS